jgi:hypothetical protein
MSRKKSSEGGSPMTAASWSGGSGKPRIPVLSTTSRMARRLLLVLAALMSLTVVTACIVPIPAEPTDDPDGGTNAYPVIVDVMPPMPGPITIDPNPTHAQSVTFTLADSDLGDTLHVKVFRDYEIGNTVSVRSLNIPPSGAEIRSTTTMTTGWCNGASLIGNHQFDVVVADRDWDDDNPNVPLPERTPKANGKTSVRSWVVQCTPSP